MDLARAAPVAIDLDGELIASYPALCRRLTLVLRDATEAEDLAHYSGGCVVCPRTASGARHPRTIVTA